MQTLASPCVGQVRLRKTFGEIPPVRQTSAGHGSWQTGQRDVVRLSSLSASLKAANGLVNFIAKFNESLFQSGLERRNWRNKW
jgi:hypothetical protein